MYSGFLTNTVSIPLKGTYIFDNDIYVEQNKNSCLSQCCFDINYFNLNHADNLGIRVPLSIIKSVKKRQSEFVSGRYMAKKCLEIMDVMEYQLEIGSSREPLWPKSFLGSISHTSSRAMALVAKKEYYRYVGIDIENILDRQTADKIQDSVHSYHEKSLFTAHGISSEVATSIIFSAKESLFKSTFIYINEYFSCDFYRVVGVDAKNCLLTIELHESLARYCFGKVVFNCRFFVTSDYVVTIILS